MQADIPFLIGHRGACGHAPENTLPSLRKAADLGLKWVEVDVKLSSDGVPFLKHDETLERCSNGEGAVRDTKWSVLSKLDAGSWFGASFAGTRFLKLEEAIGHMAVLDLGCNFEIKPCPGVEQETAEVTCRTLKRHWPDHLPAPMLSSYAEICVAAARKAAPEWPCAMVLDEVPHDWRERMEAIDASALHVWHERVKDDEILPVIDAGIPVRAFTVNQRTRAVELADMGFAGVFSDFPERIDGVVPARDGDA